MATANLSPTLLSSSRIQPSSPPPSPTTTPLSIIDATVVTFAPSTAIWIYPSPLFSAPGSLIPNLIASLSHTLSSYPHFAGQFQLTPYLTSSNPPHTERFRRCKTTYGTPTDPGVLFETSSIHTSVDALFPSTQARATTHRVWDATSIGFQKWFFPQEPMPAQGLVVKPGLSSVQIRITHFECGGVAIGIRIFHPLADAHSLVQFARDWGRVNRAVMRGEKMPQIEALFEPALVDREAAGNVDAKEPDEGVLKVAEGLGLGRFDWWLEEGRPARLEGNAQVVIPEEVPPRVAAARRAGRRIPWEEWDLSLPVSHWIVRISGDEVDRLYSMATIAAQAAERGTAHEAAGSREDALLRKEIRISRQDVLLAFVWQLIARARNAQDADSDEYPSFYIDTTLGLRPRLGLPATFVGSPVLLTSLSATYESVAGLQWNSTAKQKSFPSAEATAMSAARLRKHTIAFDSERIAALLHEMAFEVAPQRIWNGFLGRCHTMATSWVRAGVWSVDFGFSRVLSNESDQGSGRGQGLQWAGNVMPVLDGLVTVTEAETTPGDGRQDWWKGGVDLDINMEKGTMVRALQMLEAWRSEE